MDKISVSIPGGNGRMGKTLLRLILDSDNYKISSATCLPDEEEVGLDIGNLVGKGKIALELQSDPMSLFENSDVLIDFTVPEATMFHAKKCCDNNMAIVIGTTGLDNQQEEELLNLSKKIPIVYSANFSIGVTLLSSLVEDAS
jgi:4-hydroxy-tetrahydrodipicolinate reductase